MHGMKKVFSDEVDNVLFEFFHDLLVDVIAEALNRVILETENNGGSVVR